MILKNNTMDNKTLLKIAVDISGIKTNMENIDKHLEKQNSKIMTHEQDIKKINKILNIYRGKEIILIGLFIIILNYIMK